jgi:hypothetical protein
MTITSNFPSVELQPETDREFKVRLEKLSFYDLLIHAVNNTSRARFIREEIGMRLVTDLALADYLQAYHPGASKQKGESSQHREASAQDPRSRWSCAPLAQEILESGWDFTGLNSTPQEAAGLLQDIVQGDWSEQVMSNRQYGFWMSIKGKYRRWRQGRR